MQDSGPLVPKEQALTEDQAKARIKGVIRDMVGCLPTNYFGCILSRLNVVVDDTMSAEYAVSPNGELLVNPRTRSLVKGNIRRSIRDLLHEAGHIALEHFERKDALGVSKGNFANFNIAADCAIEHLMDESYPNIPGDPKHHEHLNNHIPRSQWGESSTEDLYGSIKTADTEEPDADSQDSHIPSLTPLGSARLKAALMGASQEAIDEAKNKMGSIRSSSGGTETVPDAVKELLHWDSQPNIPKTSYDLIKREFKRSFGKGEEVDDGALSQRYLLRREFMGSALMGRKNPIAPDDEGDQVGWHSDITVFADVSGSMSSNAIKRSFKVVHTLAKEYGVFPINVHTYSRFLKQHFVIKPDTDIDRLDIHIGGGTDIDAVLNSAQPKSKLVIILTDMDDAPLRTWDYLGTPLWLIHDNYGTDFKNFIGQKIFINDII